MAPLTRTHDDLHSEHTKEAIAQRLAAATQHSYLGDFVLGAIDGAVTTFAIVAGVAGAGLSAGVAVVLGIANVLADGFSMAVSNYLKTKSDHDLVAKARRIEEQHIDMIPHGEREEVRQIFKSKGFEGELLEGITDTITQNRKVWVDTMLTDELGLQLELPSPVRAGLSTFTAFLLAGAIPILPMFLSNVMSPRTTFAISAVLTGIVFAGIGLLKGQVTHQPLIRSMLETLVIGGGAASVAYIVGNWLRGLAGDF